MGKAAMADGETLIAGVDTAANAGMGTVSRVEFLANFNRGL